MKIKHLLAVSIALAIAGCGNTDSDKPDAPKPPPKPSFSPTIEGYSTASGINLEDLAGLNGQALLDGIEEQLNANLNKKSGGLFTVTPVWGFGVAGWGDEVNAEVTQTDDGAYVIKTLLPAATWTRPSADNAVKNGFKFLISLPDGAVKEAALSYKFMTTYAYGNQADRSADYIFTPGLTSGDIEPVNATVEPGKGFTYKFSTDMYGYYNTRFGDMKDNKFFNQQILVDGAPPRLGKDTWVSVQLNIKANDAGQQNGDVDFFYNGMKATAKAGEPAERVLIDATHNYSLQATIEGWRHAKHYSSTEANIKDQTLYITDLVIGWN